MAVAESLRLFLKFEPQSFGQPPRTNAAIGCALVTADVSVCRKVVGSGVIGRWAPVRNWANLANAISQLYQDAPMGVRLAPAARRGAVEWFDDRIVRANTVEA